MWSWGEGEEGERHLARVIGRFEKSRFLFTSAISKVAQIKIYQHIRRLYPNFANWDINGISYNTLEPLIRYPRVLKGLVIVLLIEIWTVLMDVLILKRC